MVSEQQILSLKSIKYAAVQVKSGSQSAEARLANFLPAGFYQSHNLVPQRHFGSNLLIITCDPATFIENLAAYGEISHQGKFTLCTQSTIDALMTKRHRKTYCLQAKTDARSGQLPPDSRMRKFVSVHTTLRRSF